MVGGGSAANINLFCSIGTLSQISEFGQAKVWHNVTCKDDGNEFEFTPKECSYSSDDFALSSKERINILFKKLCYDRKSCSFPLDNLMFTNDCTSPFWSTELVYFLEVSCSSDFIYVFGDTNFTLPKKSVGVILVSIDILIVLTLFSLLSFQGWNESLICE